jgi:cobalamin biosynthetic protein CobC
MKHGGDLKQATKEWGIPAHFWLDMSTGINPHMYPLSAIPAASWQNLPYDQGRLLTAARQYYQCRDILAVNGTQQAIELLPQLFCQQTVAVPRFGYQEHALSWSSQGHELVPYDDWDGLLKLVEQKWVDTVVLINPNNPTGHLYSQERVVELAQNLASMGAWLVLDEAFMDLSPEQSLAPMALPNVIVLRSMGKFFGLAGIRVGFVIAPSYWLEGLRKKMGLWQLAGPSSWLAADALSDHQWQAKNKARIEFESYHLALKLGEVFPGRDIVCRGLFTSLLLPKAEAEHAFEVLALRGVLVRMYLPLNDTDSAQDQAVLRFGLIPEAEDAEARFDEALEALKALKLV